MSREPSRRITSLDGLRGVAAFVVLIHHSLSLVPALAAPYVTAQSVSGSDWGAWLLWNTPLHLVWAGPEAVYVFFVLSGIVLTLPVLGARGRFDWLAYYPKRLVRLYVPVLAAVALAMLAIVLIPRHSSSGQSVWLNTRGSDIVPMSVIKDVSLVFGISGNLGVLWSLRWEVFFSLLLPLFVLAVTFLRRLLWLKLVLILGVIALGAVTMEPVLFYMPMFAIGGLIASELSRLEKLASVLSRMRGAWLLFAVTAVLLTSTYWLVIPFGGGRLVDNLTRVPVFLGTTLIVVLAAFWPAARRVLNSPASRWLGAISFSLYLVHEPIVVAFGTLIGPERPLLAALLSVTVALPVAWLFFKLIEGPSHRLSLAVGRSFVRLRRSVDDDERKS